MLSKDMFIVKRTKNKGMGLFAKKFIPKGTMTWVKCNDCRIINAEEFNKLPKIEQNKLLKHAYCENPNELIMPCDNAIYFNHSCNANTSDAGNGHDITIRDINKGEEATFDYRFFCNFKMKKTFKMKCHCGEKNCCKIVRLKMK